jgi:hypothetical protein
MNRFRTPILAVIALSSTIALIQTAEGATVRRHVHCFAYATGIVLPIVNQQLPGAVQITNNWSFSIPAGTVYTYTYAGKQKSYQAPSALAPNAVLSIGDPAVTANAACDATYPDPGFGGGKLKNLTNMPNATLQVSP